MDSSSSLHYMCRDFLQSVNNLCSQEDFKSATEILKDLYSRILPSFFIQDTPHFHPYVIKYLIKSLIPLAEFKKEISFIDYVDNFIKHILTLGVSFCPKFMLQAIPSIINQNKQPIFYQYLTSYYSILVSGYLPYDKAALCVDDLYSMIFSTPATFLTNIPESILFLLLHYKSEDDIANLILLFTNSNSIRSLQILLSKNIDALLPTILLSAPPKTVSKTLSCIEVEHLKKLDIIPALARFSDLLVEDMPVKINYVLSTLKKLVPYVNQSNFDGFKPILKIILKKLKENPDFNPKHKYLSVLIESEKYKLIKLEEFQPYLEKYNALCLKEILQLYNNLINRGDNTISQIDEKYFDLLKKITSIRNKRSYGALIKLFTNDSDNLKQKLGEERYNFIYNRIFYPIPYDEKLQSLIIDLLIKNNDYSKFNEVVYDLIEYQTIEHSESYINKLRSAINDQFHILINPSKLDWFGQFSYQYFTFIEKNVTAGFYEEFLREKFVKPKNTDYLLRALINNSKTASPSTFKQACSVLKIALQTMGYLNKFEFSRRCIDYTSVQDPDSDESHWWFSSNDFQRLFNRLGDQTITESRFGIIVTSIVDLVINLTRNHKEVDGSIIIFLTLCSRFLKPCLPKAACKLLSCVYDRLRYKDQIKNFEKERQQSYESEFALFFETKIVPQKQAQQQQQQQQSSEDKSESSERSDVFGNYENTEVPGNSKAMNEALNEIFSGYQIHFNASPEFVKMYLTCFGQDHLFNDDRVNPFVRDAISKDAEIAKMFQSYFNQPLPLMPTFTYFTDEKHKEWAEECKSKIPKIDWILLPSTTKSKRSSILPTVKSSYKFVKPEIEKGPQLHKLEPSTKYGLISFLFHSDRKYVYPFITKEILKEIENYVFENVNPNDDKNDPRLLLGYICFAMSHGIELDVLKWLKKAEIKDNKDKLTIYASALLLEAARIKKDLSKLPEVTQYYERNLDKLGIYDHSPESIVRIFETNCNTIDDFHYRKNNGNHLSSFEWLFVRSVIGLDILKYEKFSPLRITGEFSDITNGEKVIQYGLQLLERDQSFTNLVNFVSSLTYLYIGNTRNRHFWVGKCRYNYILPSNTLYHSAFVMFDQSKRTEAQKAVDYGKGMSTLILKSFKKFNFSKTKTIPLSVEHFLVNLSCTEREYVEIIQLIRQKTGHNPDLMMHNTYNVDDLVTNDTVATEALNFRPPSEVRKFYRCLLRHTPQKRYHLIKNAMDKIIATKLDSYNVPPPVNIRNLNINDKNCNSSFIVFPELCYTGALYFGMVPWNLHDYDINLTNSNYGTFLCLRKFDLETLMGCRIEMMEPNYESVNMFKTIATITNDDLKASKAWPDSQTAIREFLEVLLTTAVSEKCPLCITESILKTVIKTVKIEFITEIVATQNFLLKGNFPNVLLLFRRVEKLLELYGMNELAHKSCSGFHKIENNIFKGDKMKNEAFVDPNSEESIFQSLHAHQSESSYSIAQTKHSEPKQEQPTQNEPEQKETAPQQQQQQETTQIEPEPEKQPEPVPQQSEPEKPTPQQQQQQEPAQTEPEKQPEPVPQQSEPEKPTPQQQQSEPEPEKQPEPAPQQSEPENPTPQQQQEEPAKTEPEKQPEPVPQQPEPEQLTPQVQEKTQEEQPVQEEQEQAHDDEKQTQAEPEHHDEEQANKEPEQHEQTQEEEHHEEPAQEEEQKDEANEPEQ